MSNPQPPTGPTITHVTVLDTETATTYTPDSGKQPIIEVAAARLDLRTREVTDRYETLIKPWGPQTILCPNPPDEKGMDSLSWILGDYHTKAGHFAEVTHEEWQKAPSWHEVRGTLADRFLIPGATCLGQNPGFDLRGLKRDWSGLRNYEGAVMEVAYKIPYHNGFEWPKLDYHVIDLASGAMFLYMRGILNGLGLRYSGPWAGCPPQRHRAGSDIDDTIRVFWAMYDHFTGPLLDYAPTEPPAMATKPSMSGPDFKARCAEVQSQTGTCPSGFSASDHRQGLCNC